jgi:hypothetical protein
MRLVLDGKLQPCSPTFVDRNAIIAADQAITGGKDFCLIWEVLQRTRVNASAGDKCGNIKRKILQDLLQEQIVHRTVDIDQENVMRVYPNPSTGNITVQQL